MITIKVAGHTFALDNRFGFTAQRCAQYMAETAAEATFAADEKECLFENQDGGRWPMEYLEFKALHRKVCSWLFTNDNTLLFHCVAVKKDSQGILFTAPSGTGKTTHARLWHQQYPSEVVTLNGDTPILRFEQDGVRVYGSPWSGKEDWNTNDSAPLHSIVVLHQAPENSIRRLSPTEAFVPLMEQSFRSSLYTPAEMQKTMLLVKRLCSLPVYSLGCTISTEAARLCHDAVFQL